MIGLHSTVLVSLSSSQYLLLKDLKSTWSIIHSSFCKLSYGMYFWEKRHLQLNKCMEGFDFCHQILTSLWKLCDICRMQVAHRCFSEAATYENTTFYFSIGSWWPHILKVNLFFIHLHIKRSWFKCVYQMEHVFPGASLWKAVYNSQNSKALGIRDQNEQLV